jgi:hypothetical protein
MKWVAGVVVFMMSTMIGVAQQTDTLPLIIRTITIDRRDIFDEAGDDWFFAASLLNALHTTTKQFVVEDEFLFE